MIIIMGSQVVVLVGVGIVLSKTFPEWPYLIGLILLVDVIVFFVMSKKLRVIKRDLEERTKIAGRFIISDKRLNKNTSHITISAGGENIELTIERGFYNSLTKGEEMHIEYAEHSKFLLKAEKSGG